MPRLARRSAGTKVQARAALLSDDLLVVEEDQFARTAQALVDLSPSIEKLLTRRVDVSILWRDPAVRNGLSRRLDAVVEEAREGVVALLEASWLLAIESIWDELTLCEQTLAPKFAGVADQGVAGALMALDQQVEGYMPKWDDAMATVKARTMGAADEQVTKARSLQEPSDVLVRRMLASEQARLPGLGGRGVLWGLVSGSNLASRTASIDAVNLARVTAMQGMNRAHRARR